MAVPRMRRNQAIAVAALCGLLVVTGSAIIAVRLWPTPSASPRSQQDPSRPVEPLKPADAVLAEEKQNHIWDVEHTAFELETRFGRPFVSALLARDAAALQSHLLPDFRGTVLSQASSSRTHHGPLHEVSFDTPDTHSPPLDRAAFARWLTSELDKFTQISSGRLRVLQLDRDHQQHDRWKATLLMTVAGRGMTAQSLLRESVHDVTVRFKSDEQLGIEPVIEQWRALSAAERGSQQTLMEEVTDAAGLSDLALPDNWRTNPAQVQQYWTQVAVDDFDADGDPDIAVATFLGQPLLLRCDPGPRFTDVTAEMGIRSWPYTPSKSTNLVVWMDYDNDAYPDLIMGDRLYHNEAGGGFVDMTLESGLEFQHHPMGGVVADYDCDGRLDLYVLYQHSAVADVLQEVAGWVGDSSSGAPNQLWRNEGDGRFRNVTMASQAGGGRRKSFAAAWHFYDDDRYPDLYIANDFGTNVHLRNRGDGKFEDVSGETGMQDFATSMGVAAGDIDNDGSPEIYVANMYSKMGRRIIAHVSEDDYPPGIFAQVQGSCAGNRLYRRDGAKQFVDVSERFGVNPVGWAYAPALCDLDGDGWLDIYATAGFMSFDRQKPDG